MLMGDYNIDLSKQNTNNQVTDYLNELYSAGCYSLINKPTRKTDTSATTLDHIYIQQFTSENFCKRSTHFRYIRSFAYILCNDK